MVPGGCGWSRNAGAAADPAWTMSVSTEPAQQVMVHLCYVVVHLRLVMVHQQVMLYLVVVYQQVMVQVIVHQQVMFHLRVLL